MTVSNAAILFVAATLAGTLNSVAGGGSFISFPALILTGVLPVPANATSTVALWPGSVASIGAYRKKMPRNIRLLTWFTVISVLGGVLGAALLLHTPQATFMHLVPYLFLVATLLFTFGNDGLSKALERWVKRRGAPSGLAFGGATLVQLLIALYGGFFGGGIGIMMLALLAVIRLGDIHNLNAVKSLLAAAINGAAVVTFILARKVVWPQAFLMLAGAILGGYGGAHFAQKLDARVIRRVVIVTGFSMTLYFLWR
jgi:uncharacterized protein